MAAEGTEVMRAAEAKAAAGRVGAAEAATAVVSIFDRSRRSR